MSLITILFAPFIFFISILSHFEYLEYLDSVENLYSFLQVKAFALLGFPLEFKRRNEGFIIITDSSSLLGSVITEKLCQQGFTVFGCCLNQTDLSPIISKIKLENRKNLIPISLDVTKQESIQECMKKVIFHISSSSKPKELIGLVNTTGYQIKSPLESVGYSDWEQIFAINTIGPIATISAFLPLLRESKGRIINITSFAGHTSSPFNGAFASSKMALENYSDTLRNELYPFGVSVSLVIPGAIGLTSGYDKRPSSNIIISPLYSALQKTSRLVDEEIEVNHFSPDIIHRAVSHALFSSMPKTRYYVGLDSKITKWMIWASSDRFLDWYKIL